jgi:multiple sugar transport system permease protein
MAFSSVFVVPILVLFLALQRRIVAGLTAGALK